jgi:hypothetical protein
MTPEQIKTLAVILGLSVVLHVSFKVALKLFAGP